MKSKKPIITPDMLPHIDIDTKNIKPMSPEQRKQFKKSRAYKKYVKPAIERDKQIRREQKREWWWNRGIQLINLLLALIAAITGIIAIILR